MADQKYIILLKEDADEAKVKSVKDKVSSIGGKVTHEYDLINGFAWVSIERLVWCRRSSEDTDMVVWSVWAALTRASGYCNSVGALLCLQTMAHSTLCTVCAVRRVASRDTIIRGRTGQKCSCINKSVCTERTWIWCWCAVLFCDCWIESIPWVVYQTTTSMTPFTHGNSHPSSSY